MRYKEVVTFSITSPLLLVKINCKYYLRKRFLNTVNIIAEKDLKLQMSVQFKEAMFAGSKEAS